MFHINRRTDYAVRIMLAVAKQPPGQRLSAHTIERQMLIPHAFTHRIVADLAKKGLLITRPGPKGGIWLAREKDQINLRHIYEAIETSICLSDCLSPTGACPLNAACPVHPHWARLQDLIVHELEGITLQHLYLESLEREQGAPIGCSEPPGTF